MKDVFGREWEMVTLKDKKKKNMDDILKFVGGIVLFTFALFYAVAVLFAPIGVMWLFLIH